MVVITGATRGLGRALVDTFIAQGHTVAGCGRSTSHIASLQEKHREPHYFETVDVASDEDVRRWSAIVIERHGPPDLLLNNAAIINRNAPLWKVPPEEFSRVVDTNIKGVVNVIRHFLPGMAARGTGVIVNWSSGWGRSTSAEVAPYCATKWAIEGLTQALSQELPAPLAAIAVNPGVINTEMLQSCFGSGANSYPSPARWAQTAVPFLLRLGPSDNGKPMTAP